MRSFWHGGWRDPSSTAEGIDLVKSIEQGKDMGSLGTVPLQVIVAGTFLNEPSVPANMRPMLQERWQELQMQFLVCCRTPNITLCRTADISCSATLRTLSSKPLKRWW